MAPKKRIKRRNIGIDEEICREGDIFVSHSPYYSSLARLAEDAMRRHFIEMKKLGPVIFGMPEDPKEMNMYQHMARSELLSQVHNAPTREQVEKLTRQIRRLGDIIERRGALLGGGEDSTPEEIRELAHRIEQLERVIAKMVEANKKKAKAPRQQEHII